MNNQNEDLSKESLKRMMEIMDFKKVEGTEELTGPEIYSKFEFILNNTLGKEGLDRLRLNPNAVLAKNTHLPNVAFILDGKGPIPLGNILPLFKEKMRRDALNAPEACPGGTQASVAKPSSP